MVEAPERVVMVSAHDLRRARDHAPRVLCPELCVPRVARDHVDLIAIFLALALNPAVEFFERKGIRRGLAAGVVFMIALAAVGLLGLLVIPPLVARRSATSSTRCRISSTSSPRVAGRSAFSRTTIRSSTACEPSRRGGRRSRGCRSGAGDRHKRHHRRRRPRHHHLPDVLHAARGTPLGRPFPRTLPESTRPRWERVGSDIYRTVGGYVSGNLLISLIAGTVSAIVLFVLGSDYAIALAVVVGIFDLIPLAGATIAAIIVSTVAFIELGWVKGLIVVAFFIGYQQLENHVLQPVIYGRTVQMSPLAVLIAVLIGAELAGVLGALAAIPIAGTVQAIFRELLRYRKRRSQSNDGALPCRANRGVL